MRKIILIVLFLSLTIGCAERASKSLSSGIESKNIIVNQAKKHFGKPYKYGEIGPKSFDCSGFVYAVYKSVGIAIPRTSLSQSKVRGKKLSKSELKEGDMVFFDTYARGHVNHSGIYIGNAKFIHASSGRANSVTISDLNGWYRDKFRWGKRVSK